MEFECLFSAWDAFGVILQFFLNWQYDLKRKILFIMKDMQLELFLIILWAIHMAQGRLIASLIY